jgi:hypothetical protein
MQHTLARSTGEQIVMKAVLSILGFAILMILAKPAWGGDKKKDEDTLKNAATVLQQMVPDSYISGGLLSTCNRG